MAGEVTNHPCPSFKRRGVEEVNGKVTSMFSKNLNLFNLCGDFAKFRITVKMIVKQRFAKQSNGYAKIINVSISTQSSPPI